MDFGRIYEEYFRELQRYLLSLCRDSRIAEELTQETFFRAVRSAGQFREGSDLRAWLYTIARNRVPGPDAAETEHRGSSCPGSCRTRRESL